MYTLTLNLSDAQCYALSVILRDYLLFNGVGEMTRNKFERIRQELYNHAYSKLSYEDMTGIETLIYDIRRKGVKE